GDSWSVGLGVGAAASWPTRLPGEVHVAGFSGSGFSPTASHCGSFSYAARAQRAVPHGTGLVVVEGGLKDTDQAGASIARGFQRLVAELEARDVARVVVVGPAPAPARADAVPRVDRLLADLAAAAGVEYVSASGWQLTYLPDGLHPDPAGQREFGDLVADALG
ncbi:MAG TPA: GDSL-type esterase/lipase family protein, partial [Nocardioides sp.]